MAGTRWPAKAAQDSEGLLAQRIHTRPFRARPQCTAPALRFPRPCQPGLLPSCPAHRSENLGIVRSSTPTPQRLPPPRLGRLPFLADSTASLGTAHTHTPPPILPPPRPLAPLSSPGYTSSNSNIAHFHIPHPPPPSPVDYTTLTSTSIPHNPRFV